MEKQRSISTLVFNAIATILLIGIFIMGTAQMVFTVRYFHTERHQALTDAVNLAVAQSMQLLLRTDTPDTVDELRLDEEVTDQIEQRVELIGSSSSVVLTLLDTGGNVILCSNRSILMEGVAVQPDCLAQMDTREGYFGIGDLDGVLAGRYYTAGKAAYGRENQVVGYVIASSSAAGLASYMGDIFSSFILSAGLMLLLASILSIVITGRLTMPLRHIAEAARRFGSGDFSARAPADKSCEEISQLADTFNTMARNLEASDSSRSQFMGNIAHELRTPMTSIKGFVDGMLDGTIPPELYSHYLELVSQEAGRLTRLIQNMLDITKLEAGEYKADARLYDIWNTITGVVFAAEKRIEDGKVKIEGLAPDPVMVYADPDLVHQVLSNLVDNALKFTPEGGIIRFGVQKSGVRVIISVWNSGPGIAKEALPFVFDRFYKEDKSRGLNVKGSGLGLHICKVLVSLSGGKIWAESQEGEWCRFCFSLPAEGPGKKGRLGKGDAGPKK